jgi:glycosyltransferase involved in cell wall biosynthesis
MNSKCGVNDITVIINCHNENLFAYRAIKSVIRAKNYANANGISIEIIIILDIPNDETLKIVKCCQADYPSSINNIYNVSFGDLSLSRNYGISKASGKYIAFLDGDDLMGENWLYEAYNAALSHDNCIFHPELGIAFGTKFFWWQHIDQESKKFFLETLFTDNYWTSSVFALKEIFLLFPYKPHYLNEGYGYEDWHWNCETVAAGFIHKIVPNTIHFIRYKKEGSLKWITYNNYAIIHPSRYYNYLIQKMVSDEYKNNIIINNKIFSKEPILGKKTLKKLFAYMLSVKHVWKEAFITTFIKPIYFLSKRIHKERIYNKKLFQLPQWAILEANNISAFEPDLIWNNSTIKDIGYYNTPQPQLPSVLSFYNSYSAIYNKYYSHIIVLPWLKAGGADLGAIYHAKTLKNDFNSTVLIITTESENSSWRNKIAGFADFLELGKIIKQNNGDFDALIYVLTRLLIEMKPKVIHNINSRACWEVYKRHGLALKQSSKLYASLFTDDYDEFGKPIGYAIDYLENTYHNLELIFSDNTFYPKYWSDLFGIDRSKFYTLFFPVSNDLIKIGEKNLQQKISNSNTTKHTVMWTGRITRQKRPDLLAEIARQMPDIQFDVWGYSDSDDNSYRKLLSNIENIHLKGEYNDFSTLPHTEYSAYLYTSEYDGLPNALLEVAAVGIKIVGAPVGGSCDLLTEKTSYLVNKYYDVPQYCNKIREAINDKNCEKEKNALDEIKNNHSYSSWISALRMQRNYIISN